MDNNAHCESIYRASGIRLDPVTMRRVREVPQPRTPSQSVRDFVGALKTGLEWLLLSMVFVAFVFYGFASLLFCAARKLIGLAFCCLVIACSGCRSINSPVTINITLLGSHSRNVEPVGDDARIRQEIAGGASLVAASNHVPVTVPLTP